MTRRNRNILLICGAILLGYYFMRSYSNYVAAMEAARARAMQRAAMPKPVPVTAESRVDPPLPNLSGIWDGRGPIKGRGVCFLKLELKQNDPAHYSAYSTFYCMSTEPITNPKDLNVMTNMLSNMHPDSAILNGTVEKGAMHFHADKTIGTDSNGCAITDLTVTPFGASQVAAEWQEGTCPGGNLMMQRQRQ
jgi:hypothetical protein